MAHCEILNKTIRDQELEQVHVKLPLVRALSVDRAVRFIYYNSTFHLNTFKYGMENMAYFLIWALGTTMLISMTSLKMFPEAFLELFKMVAL